MRVLAVIQDPRGREPIVAMLLDRDARLREIAARALARFACPEAVAALERHVKREKVREVRITAVHALIELYEAGQEAAIRRVLEILDDGRRIPRSAWPPWRSSRCSSRSRGGASSAT